MNGLEFSYMYTCIHLQHTAPSIPWWSGVRSRGPRGAIEIQESPWSSPEAALLSKQRHFWSSCPRRIRNEWWKGKIKSPVKWQKESKVGEHHQTRKPNIKSLLYIGFHLSYIRCPTEPFFEFWRPLSLRQLARKDNAQRRSVAADLLVQQHLI